MRKLIFGTSIVLAAVAVAQSLSPKGAEVFTDDADMFAKLFEETGGAPTAHQLQERYLDKGDLGLQLLAQTRIRDAGHFADVIAADPDKYRRAIDVCLPLAKSATADLRAIYRDLSGLLPEYNLPEVHVVFGAGTSAGTAAPGVQVLGLEVICAEKQTEEDIRDTYRFFFAHETIHTFQGTPSESVYSIDPLLVVSIYEGTADYIAMTVTGRVPDEVRDQWAYENSEMIWAQYAADRHVMRESAAKGETLASLSPRARNALRRWHFNAGIAPEGWPHEAGYWVGRQIVTAYVERSADHNQAIRDLLGLKDPSAVLEASGFSDRLNHDDAPE